jgi:hypothetical protein
MKQNDNLEGLQIQPIIRFIQNCQNNWKTTEYKNGLYHESLGGRQV